MKIFKYLLLLLLTSYSSINLYSNEIEIIDFTGNSSVQHGERTVIKWEFINAKKVIIEDTKYYFNAKDSLIIHPESDNNYIFKVISNDDDTLNLNWDISIINPNDIINLTIGDSHFPYTETGDNHIEKDINTDQAISSSHSISNKSSKYFDGGTVFHNYSSKPYSLKIISCLENNSDPTSFNIKVLVIDSNGKLVKNINTADFTNFRYEIDCESIKHKGLINKIVEFNNLNSNFEHSLAIAIDNSMLAQKYQPSINIEVIKFSKSIGDNIKLSVNWFNHASQKLLTNLYKNNAYDELLENKLIQSEGLTATYRNVSNLVDYLSSDYKSKRTICLIASSKDNSSISYDINDLVELANNNNVVIHTIGIGNDIEPFALKYLSNQTGGKYYQIDSESIVEIENILKEILFASQNYYEFTINYDKKLEYLCDNVLLNIYLDYQNNTTKSNLEFSFASMPIYSMYQAIGIYKADTSQFDNQYLTNIQVIGDILKQNPSIAIQIIGHSDSKTNSNNISLNRAIEIHKLLKEYGVEPEQLRFKAADNESPLYFNPEEDCYKYLNNRVEIKWLAPSLYSYEIISQTVNSEDIALEKVIEWEKLGYDSYYERIIKNDYPVYRIKLWGFKTEYDANQAVQLLSKSYQYNFIID